VIKKTIIAIVLALGTSIFLVFSITSGEKNKSLSPAGTDISCDQCHICAKPTAEAPCLIKCPRYSKMVVSSSLKEGPAVVILDQLSNLYVPVTFPHKLHAQMTGMDQGCVACHHNSPEGHILACRKCHGGPNNPENLRQPGLKGAYHRQCMSCHREWSHDTECSACHAKKTADAAVVQITDTTDIMGRLHPNIEEPTKKLYQTTWNKGTVVTFHHKEHIDLFGLKCVDCHREESCTRCHDIEKKSNYVKTVEEHHKPCSSCHQMERCEGCHAKRENRGFTHARTGWPLSRYHQSLSCHACHPSGRKMEKLNRDCLACHNNWTTENFNHAVTGLSLDETHKQMDCADCHLGHKFDEKPSCANCHDDGRAYPESSPGTFTEKKG